ncbi:hypothetical protein F5Y04DRAFT_287916 [Hypomontagnella monticulosa]|nr:hypothetical protein F5Y04DRAFT_287916 [Hypomontagnella monticulosa]
MSDNNWLPLTPESKGSSSAETEDKNRNSAHHTHAKTGAGGSVTVGEVSRGRPVLVSPADLPRSRSASIHSLNSEGEQDPAQPHPGLPRRPSLFFDADHPKPVVRDCHLANGPNQLRRSNRIRRVKTVGADLSSLDGSIHGQIDGSQADLSSLDGSIHGQIDGSQARPATAGGDGSVDGERRPSWQEGDDQQFTVKRHESWANKKK